MTRRVSRRRRSVPTAEQLLGLLTSLPDHLVIGVEHRGDHLDLFVRPFPEDDRSGVAGLLAFVAPARWCAVGAVVGGTARDPATGRVLSTDCTIRVVVTRHGEVASHTLVDGVAIDTPSDRLETAARPEAVPLVDPFIDPTGESQGLLVDVLHRALGLPCPGAPPELPALAALVWLNSVLEHALLRGHITWPEAVELHPGDPGPSHVLASVEMLTEALVRSADDADWRRMHRRAAAGHSPTADLSAQEVAWMDTTLFARWTMSALTDHHSTIATLRTIGCEDVADRIDAVVDAVTFELSSAASSDPGIPRSA